MEETKERGRAVVSSLEREVFRRREKELQTELKWLRDHEPKPVERLIALNQELAQLTQAILKNYEEQRGDVWK